MKKILKIFIVTVMLVIGFFAVCSDEPWRNNKIGYVVDTPPPPWTDLKVTGNNNDILMQCWGREIKWKDTLFPSNIMTLGKAMLVAPIRLEAEINGEKIFAKLESLKIDSSNTVDAVLTGHGFIGKVPLTVTTKIEFDGLLVINIDLKPAKATNVKWLKLVIPMKKELVKFKFLPVYSREGVGAFDKKTGSINWRYPFINYVWIGDEECGLTWFSESSENWIMAKNSFPIAVKDSAAQTDWTIEFIGTSSRITAPLRYTIGLQPTPVKPMPEDNLQWGIGRNFQLYWTRPEMDKGFGYPEGLKPGIYDKETQASHAANMPIVRYGLITALSKASPEWKKYGKNWNSSDIVDDYSADVVAFGSSINMVCPAVPEYRDFIVWKMQKWIDENKFDGLYHDLSGVHTCTNTIHGCNGKMPILAWRELYKRVYTMLKERKQPTLQIQHVSWGLCSPILGFCDAYMNGEQYVGKNVKDYTKTVTPDLWLTEFTGRQYGVVPIFIPALTDITTEEPTSNLLKLLLLYGAPGVWPNLGYLNRDAVTEYFTLIPIIGLDKDNVEFIPYWKNESIIENVPETLKVSAYRQKDNNSLVLVILNDDTAAFKGSILLKDEFAAASNLRKTDKPAELTGKKIKFELPGKKLRLIKLDPKK